MKNRYGKIVFLTGASSGIGLATARLLKDKGFHVYGTTRNPNPGPLEPGYDGGFFKLITADVTSEEAVNKAVASVLERENTIDIVINCAAVSLAGDIEGTSPKEAMWQFDVCFFGVLRVLNAVLPIMRKQRSGLVINIGSVAGIYSVPYHSMYSAAKFALEALHRSLRIELAPFNVKATLICPGNTDTKASVYRRATAKAMEREDYRPYFETSLEIMENDEKNGMNPETVAKRILWIISRKNPPIRIVVSWIYKILVFVKRLAPKIIEEIVVRELYLPKKKVGKFIEQEAWK